MQIEVAEVLIDIEAQLRQLGLWQQTAPSAEALASNEPFGIDTLSLPQWLQFIFLPTIYRLLEAGEALPTTCSITPMAEEYFQGAKLADAELLSALARVDALLTRDATDADD